MKDNLIENKGLDTYSDHKNLNTFVLDGLNFKRKIEYITKNNFTDEEMYLIIGHYTQEIKDLSKEHSEILKKLYHMDPIDSKNNLSEEEIKNLNSKLSEIQEKIHKLMKEYESQNPEKMKYINYLREKYKEYEKYSGIK